MAGLIIWLLAFCQLIGLAGHLPHSWSDGLARTAGQHLAATLATPSLVRYQPVTVPAQVTSTPLNLTAASVLAVDLNTGQILYSHNPNAKRPIASITKLVTALVIVRDHPLDQFVTVPILPTYAVADSRLGLVAGQRLSVESLLAAMLVPSADDAADTLARFDAGSGQAFAGKMNRVASDWSIQDTHFTNPSGLVDTDNYATATALTKIAGLVLANQSLARLTATASTTITDANGRSYNLTTTNELLQNGLIKGIKTGYTPAAGQSLVGLASIDGHAVITVILGSQDRFGETGRLINSLTRDYQWYQPPQ